MSCQTRIWRILSPAFAGSNASHSEPALKCAGFKLYPH